jgi:hypothetical protein
VDALWNMGILVCAEESRKAGIPILRTLELVRANDAMPACAGFWTGCTR